MNALPDLQLFQCHKRVHAYTMSRVDFLDYTGKSTEGIDNEDGYLVVYSFGTEDEYHSWSPKKAFEEGYTLVVGEKVDPARIEALVESLSFEFARVGTSTVTGCWAFLPNGFQVGYGQSACINPDDFNSDDGEMYAKANCLVDAKKKLWELEGYFRKTLCDPVDNPLASRSADRASEEKTPEQSQERRVLEMARHELTVLHGLIATDRANSDETWEVDTSKTVAAIDDLL